LNIFFRKVVPIDSRYRISPWLCALTLVGSAFSLIRVVVAQPCSGKPVRIIVATGGVSGDNTPTRLIAPRLSESLSQQFVAENRLGAGAVIGQTLAAGALPDGYTLRCANRSRAGSRLVNAAFKLDVLREFSLVSLLQTGEYVLVVHPDVPASPQGIHRARPLESRQYDRSNHQCLAGVVSECRAVQPHGQHQGSGNPVQGIFR
jgi:hypothetical protein